MEQVRIGVGGRENPSGGGTAPEAPGWATNPRALLGDIEALVSLVPKMRSLLDTSGVDLAIRLLRLPEGSTDRTRTLRNLWVLVQETAEGQPSVFGGEGLQSRNEREFPLLPSFNQVGRLGFFVSLACDGGQQKTGEWGETAHGLWLTYPFFLGPLRFGALNPPPPFTDPFGARFLEL